MNHYGYIRVSHKAQARSGLGLAAQRAKIEEYVRSRGKRVARIFRDAAVSGSRVPFLKRPHGEALDLTVQAGDHIVIAKLDRAFRNLGDFAAMLERWHRRGVYVHLLDLGVDTSSPVGRLIAGIMAAVAEWESRRIGERIREALLVRRSQGRATNGYPSIGYKKIRKRVVPDARERRIGRELLRLRRLGHGWQAIADRMNARRLYRRGGIKWSEMSVVRWATAAKHRFPITGYHGVRNNRRRARDRR